MPLKSLFDWGIKLPLHIVADDMLCETGWELRSEPWIHLALGMGLIEELRAVKGELTIYQLGKLLRVEFHEHKHTLDYDALYGDIVRSTRHKPAMWGITS